MAHADAAWALEEWLSQALAQERQVLLQSLQQRHEALTTRFSGVLEQYGVGAGSVAAPRQGTATNGSAYDFKSVRPPEEAYGQAVPRAPAPPAGRPGELSSIAPVTRPLAVSENSAVVKNHDHLNHGRKNMHNFMHSNVITWKDVRGPETLVQHPHFEMFFVTLITISALVTGFELQYKGLDFAHKYNIDVFDHGGKSAEENFPGVLPVLEFLNFMFGSLFLLEMLLKVVGMKCLFFCSPWNLFDAMVVMVWVADRAGGFIFIVDPLVLRLVRLVRIMRIVRIFRHIQALDMLQLLVSSIIGSVSTLVWSMAILVTLMLICALILSCIVQDEINDPTYEQEPRIRMYKYFGTFTRSMLSMFELTLGNWVPICRFFVEDISERWIPALLTYMCVVQFAIVKVITGVFLHETFKVASSDDELMIMEKERLRRKHTSKMHVLLNEADRSGDGQMDWGEFERVVRDPRVSTWLSAMELDIRDPRGLFHMLNDSGDDTIAAEELIKGVSRLRGPARSLDLAMLQQDITSLRQELQTAFGAWGAGQGLSFMAATESPTPAAAQAFPALQPCDGSYSSHVMGSAAIGHFDDRAWQQYVPARQGLPADGGQYSQMLAHGPNSARSLPALVRPAPGHPHAYGSQLQLPPPLYSGYSSA